jgi:hypothetical protein
MVALVAALLLVMTHAAKPGNATPPKRNAMVRQVSELTPAMGQSREMAAERPLKTGPRGFIPANPNPHPWKLLATIPGAVIHDISFSSPTTGYVAAEAGQVWKTTDGGKTWTEVLNLGFPYYWYGVQAKGSHVVISGFNDNAFEGIIRWSDDSGTTWSSDVVLTTSGWGDRIHFPNAPNAKDGLVMDQLNLNAANAAHYTTDGGQTAANWTEVVPDPNGGWFGDQFSMLGNLHTRASGINYCTSEDGGQMWNCGPSVDSVFDGPAFFVDDKHGWVGGGEISPNVEGWVHRTTDGGSTWSGRTLDGPWPIREIFFLTSSHGWAAGGNVYSNVGGMYYSSDGGQTWTVDISTGAEMKGCASQPTRGGTAVWCAGNTYNGSSFSGVIYHFRAKTTP